MMNKNVEYPVCYKLTCFANVGVHCRCLKDNDFHGRECPFYKDHNQFEKERKIYPVIKYEN